MRTTRARVHQPVAHVRHSPWLPEPCRNSGVGRCSRSSFDLGRGERGETVSIGGFPGKDGSRSRLCMTVRTWGGDLREKDLRARVLLLRSARPRSSHHEIARRTGSKRDTYPWAFLPFLQINTKVFVAYDMWYIAFRRGACSPAADTVDGRGKVRDVREREVQRFFSLLDEYTRDGYTTGCCYFMRLSSDHCSFRGRSRNEEERNRIIKHSSELSRI